MQNGKDLYVRLGKLGVDDDRVSDYAHWDHLGDEKRSQVRSPRAAPSETWPLAR